MKNIIFLALILLVAACKNDSERVKPSECEVVKVDLKHFDFDLVINDCYDTERVLLEESRESLIGKISKIIITEHYIYVLDNDVSCALFIFKRDGGFVKRVGKQGRGPGEFLILDDFDINEQEEKIYLYAGSDRKIMIYDLQGVFQDEIRVEDCGYAIRHLGSLGFMTVNSRGLYSVSFWNKKGRKQKDFIDCSYGYISWMGQRPISAIGDSSLLSFPFDNTLYVSYDLLIRPFLTFDFMNVNYPLERINSKRKLSSAAMSGEYARIESAICFSDNILLEVSYKKLRYKCLVSRKKKEVRSYLRYMIDDIPYSSIVGETSDGLIFSSSSDLIYNYVKEYSDRIKDKEALTFYKELSLNSNPILFIATEKK